MKKIFFSLMAAVAVCVGFASCDGEDVLLPKLINLVAPEFVDKASVYEAEGGNTLELTEAGNYIYVEADTRAKGKVYVGTYTISSDDVVILKGEIEGKVDTKNGKGEISVNGSSVSLKKKNVKKNESDEVSKLCRTWNVEEKAVVDGTRVTISDDAYAKYFSSYGYPKQLIISAVGTFCVVCKNEVYAGKWKMGSKGHIIVEDVPFKEEIPYNIGEKVTVDLAVTEANGTPHTVKATLTEVK